MNESLILIASRIQKTYFKDVVPAGKRFIHTIRPLRLNSLGLFCLSTPILSVDKKEDNLEGKHRRDKSHYNLTTPTHGSNVEDYCCLKA